MKVALTWPAATSVNIGAAPRYITVLNLVPGTIRCSISVNSDGGGPGPNEATVTLPGLSLASARNSATLLAGTDGCTSSTWSTLVIALIGAKSLSGSYH